MAFFETRNLVKSYAGYTALNDVSIEVPKGSVFGLLGPNGAGKTTLIRIINQITAPDAGQVFFEGDALSPKHIFNIGYLPEERGLYKKMKIGEQAIYLARLKGLSRREATDRLKTWFEKFEISDWWDKKVEELSKGMQQKVQFIVTVLHEPKLLIFDEPFSGFDPINTNLLKREILALKESGCTIILSTHNMESVEELCDNIALIHRSRKVLGGTVSDIRRQFSNRSFELHFKGAFNKVKASMTADYEILSVQPNDDCQVLKLRLLADISSNDLINRVLEFGELTYFSELMPSMNQVFIQAIKEQQAN